MTDAKETQKVDAGVITPMDVEGGAITHRQPDILMTLLAAVEKGREADDLQSILAMIKELKADKARQEFTVAMGEFRRTCPPIPRSVKSKQATKSGRSMDIWYSTLEATSAIIDPVLNSCGLMCTWPHTDLQQGIILTVTRVTHIGNGHFEDTPCKMPVASMAGMSEQQKAGSAITYCKRYGRDAALGIVTSADDTDGVELGDEAETITPEQAVGVLKLLTDLRKLDGIDETRARMLGYLEVENVADIPATRHTWVLDNLAKKIKQANEGAK